MSYALKKVKDALGVPTADAVTDARMRDVVGKKDDTANTTIGDTSSLMRYIKGLMNLINAISSGQTVTVTEQIVTVTEQEPCVAGDIAIAAGTDVIPFSSLDSLIADVKGTETGNVIGGDDTDMAVDWITDTVFVTVYSDVTVTNYGTANAVRLESDGSTTVGANHVFLVEDDTSLCDIASVNNGRFVIFYQDSLDDGNVKAGQLDEGTLYLTFGAELNIDGNNAIDNAAICQAADDKYCLIFNDFTNSKGNLEAGSVNSSTLACTAGAEVEIVATATAEVSITKVDTDKIAAAFEGTDQDAYCVIATISTLTITAGTPIEWQDATNLQDTAICAVDATHIVIITVDVVDNNIIKAIAATISGTVPTFGSFANLSEGTDSGTLPQCAAIDSTHFIALWDNVTDSKTGYSISSVSGTTITAGARKHMSNDIPTAIASAGKCLKINSFNDIIYFGITGAVTYAVFMDIGWKDGTYVLNDILGVAKDAAGTIIVDGVDEGNASGEDPAITYFYDSRNRCVRKKDHSCQYKGYVPRVRVVAPDALKSIGG